jgi:ADP-heptose:LPS heptosyltransferase
VSRAAGRRIANEKNTVSRAAGASGGVGRGTRPAPEGAGRRIANEKTPSGIHARAPDRIVVLRALGLGDLLTALPALRGLRAAAPSAVVELAAPAWLEPVAMMSGAVDRLLPTPGLGPVPAAPWPRLAVNLHGRGPRSTAFLAQLRPGAQWSYGLPGAPAWPSGVHEVARWCGLLAAYGVECDPARLELRPPGGGGGAGGATVVHPGTAGPARRWPPERWMSVAASLAAAGHRVVVTGSAGEARLAAVVAAGAGLPSAAVLAGRQSLDELCILVAGARAVVCSDTGVGHLATAVGTPSVVLFGPVSPAEWGPPPDRPRHVPLWTGGTSDPFAPSPDPALRRITPAQVLAAVAAAEAAAGRAPAGGDTREQRGAESLQLVRPATAGP